ncbi:MAG: T9SS type A sorting domain-containing protein [Flavobacteriales bacterium]|nr:T9SS type A sorting domain-containing protein [Flavobacteriales bacterium]
MITEPSVLVAELSAGVQRLEKGQLRLQPNPTSDQLFISSDTSIDAVTVLAADGREVLHAVARRSTVILDIAGLPAGPYTLIAILADGARIPERFIKQ